MDSQGAWSSGCRFVLALMAVSMDAVGCQNARSGLSPVATLVCTPCSYGSGMVTISTFAPVALPNASTTCLGTALLFCAAQIVRVTPSSLAVGSAQVVAAASPAAPPAVSAEESTEGSLQAAAPAAITATTARVCHFFMVSISLLGGARTAGPGF
ncbi:hypothetical protein [Microbispora sp. GKU 823]|uniref:hypothetical protein n=1 Tax=Microbispora sp. GKU 823 TaxID=1652100 RepID=UPI001C4DE1B3|nr:hypothetical protein [Microbispora sp. GKU 823]